MPDDIIIRLKGSGPVDDATREDAVNEIARLRTALSKRPMDKIDQMSDALLDLCESIIATTEQIQEEIQKGKADGQVETKDS